jgi:hypothetical protein
LGKEETKLKANRDKDSVNFSSKYKVVLPCPLLRSRHKKFSIAVFCQENKNGPEFI